MLTNLPHVVVEVHTKDVDYYLRLCFSYENSCAHVRAACSRLNSEAHSHSTQSVEPDACIDFIEPGPSGEIA